MQLLDFTTYSCDLPAAFLDRAKQDGYNYVLVETPLNPAFWDTAQGIVISDSLRIKLTAAFVAANNHGLRLIPLYQMMHGCATIWANINHNIARTWNTFQWVDSKGTPHYIGCPSLSSDPYGQRQMDSTVNQLILTTKTAFDSAHLSYPLEYIHLGHDEFMATYDAPRMLNIATTSLRDRAYIWTFDKNHDNQLDSGEVQEGIQSLIAQEIDRRVSQIQRICGSETKVMLWGDMFDPQFNGGTHWRCLMLGSTKTITTAGALSKISSNGRSNILFMPWNYSAYVSDENGFSGHYYDSKTAFQYFKDNNCRFAWTYAIDSGTISSDNIKQLNSYVCASGLTTFQGYCGGYCAATWYPWNPQNKAFRVLEYIAQTVDSN